MIVCTKGLGNEWSRDREGDGTACPGPILPHQEAIAHEHQRSTGETADDQHGIRPHPSAGWRTRLPDNPDKHAFRYQKCATEQNTDHTRNWCAGHGQDSLRGERANNTMYLAKTMILPARFRVPRRDDKLQRPERDWY